MTGGLLCSWVVEVAGVGVLGVGVWFDGVGVLVSGDVVVVVVVVGEVVGDDSPDSGEGF